ncbi:calcium-binding protein [Sphingomonas sp.]|uniref:calcium-binding protein n=1 Tax=Sphingomonas sp. TaxID=28214 RepID=UPI0035C821CC
MRTYHGTNRRDIFDGSNQAERVFAYGGNDDIFGYGGNDLLYGGGGNDLLVGDNGNDKLYGEAGSDLLAGERGNDRVDGGKGFDYATYFYAPKGANVNLATGRAQDGFGGTDTLVSIEGVYGSKFADTIRGDGGTNELFGNQGNDTLIGGGGQDLLVGNKGADRFVFNDGDVGEKLANADLIGDFSRREGDEIDLSGLDANANQAGDQAFTFVGGAAFSGKAGELRFEGINGEGVLMGDVDGDGMADGFIRVDTAQAILAGDLVL